MAYYMNVLGCFARNFDHRVVYSNTRDGLGAARYEDVSLASRFRAWKNGGSLWYGTIANMNENVQAKRSFYESIKSDYGEEIARNVFAAEGISNYLEWIKSPRPLKSRLYNRIIISANGTFRVNTKRFFEEFCKGEYSPGNTSDVNPEAEFNVRLPASRHTLLISLFKIAARKKYWIGGGMPISRSEQTDIANFVYGKLRGEFKKRILTLDEMSAAAKIPIEIYVANDFQGKAIEMRKIYTRVSEFLGGDCYNDVRLDLTITDIPFEGRERHQKGIAEQVSEMLKNEEDVELIRLVPECIKNLEGAEFALMRIKEVAKQQALYYGQNVRNMEILYAALGGLKSSLEIQKKALLEFSVIGDPPGEGKVKELCKRLFLDMDDRYVEVCSLLEHLDYLKPIMPWDKNRLRSAIEDYVTEVTIPRVPRGGSANPRST